MSDADLRDGSLACRPASKRIGPDWRAGIERSLPEISRAMIVAHDSAWWIPRSRFVDFLDLRRTPEA
jgi:hypothetical protein